MSTQRNGSLLWVALAVLAAIVLLPALMMAFMMPMMGMMGGWGVGPGTGSAPIWGLGTMLLALVAVFGVGYFLYRGLAGSRTLRRDRAMEELRTAYARGDLSDEEFERRRERLRRDRE